MTLKLLTVGLFFISPCHPTIDKDRNLIREGTVLSEKQIKTGPEDMALSSAVQPAEAAEINVFRRNDISDEQKALIRRHRQWLDQFRKEYPLPSHPYRIGVYIRFFNQTKYKNYLDYHKKDFTDTIALCPLWTLVDFYVDHGPSAPNIESAPELCRLLNDCRKGKVDLVITQKISNMSRKAWDLTLILRILAGMNVGVYFINEDVFTMATYYSMDRFDSEFLVPGLEPLPDDEDAAALPEGEDDVE